VLNLALYLEIFMTFLKRIFLFMLTNIAVVVTISILLNLLGVKPYITAQGLDYNSLLVFCLVWGMVGAFISLQMSRWMAKMTMGVKLIDPNSSSGNAELYRMVERLSKAAGLPKTPEVGIFESPEVNAFATGPSKNRALVAFSSGLLGRMNKNEIEGVAGHEIAHIANGDMVTMALLQGVINAFVMFLSRVIAFAITTTRGSNDEERPTMLTYILIPVLEIAFSFLGMIVVGYFSRKREFRADFDSSRFAGREKMIAALESLQRAFGNPVTAPQTANGLDSLKISGRGGFMRFFSTHPPLEERLEALRSMKQFH